jgi:hypothetical protein
MKILTVLTYYRPHTSGLTIYAERLARAFAKRGHEVTVMTTQYDPSLPREETMDGVRVIRVPVLRVSARASSRPPSALWQPSSSGGHDVVQMHLPQFDAPGVALRGRLFGKPAVLTYHCDLQLPSGLFNRVVNTVVDFQNNMAGTPVESHCDLHTGLRRQLPLPLALRLQTDPDPASRRNAGSAPRRGRGVRKGTSHPASGVLSLAWSRALPPKKGSRSCWMPCPSILGKYPKAQILCMPVSMKT